jgi:plasmid stability protein
MAKMIQIRHVPDEVHRALVAKAAAQGLSLSDYLRAEVTKVAERPSMDEVLARIRELPPVAVRESSAEVIRRWRDLG